MHGTNMKTKCMCRLYKRCRVLLRTSPYTSQTHILYSCVTVQTRPGLTQFQFAQL